MGVSPDMFVSATLLTDAFMRVVPHAPRYCLPRHLHRHPEEPRTCAASRRRKQARFHISPAVDPSRLAALRRAPQDDGGDFSFINIKFFESCGILIPVSRTSLILLASCPVRGAS